MILFFMLIFVAVKYHEYKNETTCLSKKINILLIKNRKDFFINPVAEINIMQQLDWDTYVNGLYATSAIYFCSIKKGNNETLLNNLNKSSKVCKLWTINSKKKYVEKFSTYSKDRNQSSIEKMYDCALKGIDIVDMVCLDTEDSDKNTDKNR